PDWLLGMAISGHHHDAGPAAVLASVRDQVAELDTMLWAAQPDDEVIDVVEQVQALKATVAAIEADAVAEVEARQIAKKSLHHATPGGWATPSGGPRRGEGKRIVDRALALTGPLQRTKAQMVAGVVSPAQAEVITKTMAALPGAPPLRGRAETTLLD